jgi:anthranilate phosphoribosyltransferase
MTYSQTQEVFEKLFTNQLSEEEGRQLLVELYERGESAEEIAAAAHVMQQHAVMLPIPKELQTKIIDNCGTGGDKSGSFNVSTTVSFVLAGAGSFVAKHGNRSITSKSGSADVLETLGVNLSLSPDQLVTLLEESGFAFMFAINHHPAMKHIMPIRKSLDHRTIFNILGPLTSPAGVKKQLIGVFDASYIEKVAYALEQNQATSAMVVSSRDGMDEIAISSVTDYAELQNGKIYTGEINPERFGFSLAPFEAIKGGDANENAEILRGVLDGSIRGAKRDIVLLNAGAALVVDGKARDMQDGIDMAKEAILSGKAISALNRVIEVSNKL